MSKDTPYGEKHYKGIGMEPLVFINAADLRFMEGCVVKYAARHPQSKEPVADLYDAANYCYLILRDRYGCGPYVDGRPIPMYSNVPAAHVISVVNKPQEPINDVIKDNLPSPEDWNELHAQLTTLYGDNATVSCKRLLLDAVKVLRGAKTLGVADTLLQSLKSTSV